MVAVMYDDEALYLGAKVGLPGRGIQNPNNPADAFWWGDEVEFRRVADPALPWPIVPGSKEAMASDRTAHVTLWKNSATGKDYLHLAYGLRLHRGKAVNPEGSQIVIKPSGTESYTIEAKILRGPRGLALDSKGDLYAVSYVPDKAASVVVFRGAQGAPQTVVSSGLEAPWGVGVDADGHLHVSDLGKSQQVKTFSADGKLLRVMGKAGFASLALAGARDYNACQLSRLSVISRARKKMTTTAVRRFVTSLLVLLSVAVWCASAQGQAAPRDAAPAVVLAIEVVRAPYNRVLDDRVWQELKAFGDMQLTGRSYATANDTWYYGCGGTAGHYWYAGSGWRDRAQKLYDLAGEVTRQGAEQMQARRARSNTP